jgi:hypothetical protein
MGLEAEPMDFHFTDTRQSSMDDLCALLVAAHFWRSRLVELCVAGPIFFCLGFGIAMRCF